MKYLLFGASIVAALSSTSASAQQVSQQQRADLTLRTVIAQRDAAAGQAQLLQMDIIDLQQQIADLKKKLSESEKAEPTK